MADVQPQSFTKIKGNIYVSVPDDIRILTSYVLREQEDWFEDEIKFARVFFQPGMRIVDIGANYGVYTLTAANILGPSGMVWAFEPCSETADYLEKSIYKNKKENVEIVRAAVSDRTGEASLVVTDSSEMCFLSNDNNEEGKKEFVNLVTLDGCMDKHGLLDIDLVKIDAEGHESQVISGGMEFFKINSPLVMYEIKAGDEHNLDLHKEFKKIGYNSYILIPGLNILAPFSPENDIDSYVLNLFCCKEDQASELEKRGMLVRQIPETNHRQEYARDWIEFMQKLTYWNYFEDHWSAYKETGSPESISYQNALDCYSSARANTASAALKYTYLLHCYDLLRELIEINATFSRLLSFARVCSDLGRRVQAIEIARRLISMIQNKQQADLSEPFLPVSLAQESTNPNGNTGSWLISGILETYEKMYSFSSYYKGIQALELLKTIKNSGFQSPEMERRYQLVRMASQIQNEPNCTPLLAIKSDDNLNPEYWCN